MTSSIENKGKKSHGEKHSSDAEPCHYTHLGSGMLAPQNYKMLVGGSDEEEEEEYNDHSAIATPRSYESFPFGGEMVHTTRRSSEIYQRLKAQERLI